jgi:hypothetical protein
MLVMFRGGTKRALLLFVLSALLVSQAVAAFEPEHSNNHSNHCCAACHVGHALALSSWVGLVFAEPDNRGDRQLAVNACSSVPEPLITNSGSRAPPA